MSKKIIQKKEENIQNIKLCEPLKIFIAVAPFLVGIYYEWASCIVSLILLVYLWYCFKMTGRIRISWNLMFVSALLIPAFYGISVLWAVDSGMTLLGMMKYLPLPVFTLAVQQIDKEKRKNLVDYVPISGAIMVVCSAVLGLIPILSTYFKVNGRLAGFFQYPNTFALYLLLGIIVLATVENQWKIFHLIIFLSLLAGIMLTGSRTGFLLLLATFLCFCFIIRERRLRLKLIGIFVLMMLVIGIYVFITGNVESVGRFLTSSLSSSTFLGRLLYFKDSLMIILQHPLGLGYMGYYFTQGAFQTGVYSVINIHNELLQLLLDIGWIPALIFTSSVIRGIILGGIRERLLIIIIFVHSMFDFNLQFLAICFILIVSIAVEEKDKEKTLGKEIFLIATILISCMSLYCGIDSALYYVKQYEAAAALYPGNTNAWMQILIESEDVEEMDEIAEKILDMNPNNPLANNAKARAAYAKGDFRNVISYKVSALQYYRYALEEYLDYFNMLYVGYQLYMNNGDRESAAVCRQQILEIPMMIKDVLEETDPIAYQIYDKPDLELPEEYQTIIDMLK